MDEQQRRKVFQWVKSLTNAKFWSWMNFVHSRAYAKAQQHYEEAMSIVLQPKQAAAVTSKAKEIRESWDGMAEITMEETEGTEFKAVGV
ncbi:hypothetical protein [Paenibacillus graminis]|uniref:hypothetical protein n=1 Tax=Paenibacillus graminis TaxID=189425 RepID=UPI002DBCD502|nr:hypothetical protein [Paenibacillus graminis]MEC0169884.1 hypothetical protein [Paenibacillus graminis]